MNRDPDSGSDRLGGVTRQERGIEQLGLLEKYINILAIMRLLWKPCILIYIYIHKFSNLNMSTYQNII